MKRRLFVTALALAVLAVATSWVFVQPLAGPGAGGLALPQLRLIAALLNFVLLSLTTFLILQWVVGRDAEALARRAAQLGDPDREAGPLLRRIERALRRTAVEIEAERELNQRRLAELTASRDSLFRLQAELVSTDRLATVGKLAAGVAHEVGNPLAGILGYLSVVRMRSKDPELLDVVQRIEAEVQRIDSIVRSLLDLGRPSRGAPSPIDVRPLIESSVRLLVASRDFGAVEVRVDAPPSTWLCAEPGPLSQVLINLLMNAAQAMAFRGRIEIVVSGNTIVVQDDGPGIPEPARPRLFEPFFTTRKAGEGTGLGLAVSRHLMQQAGGQLHFEPGTPRGARFVITLPAPASP